jgi:hypothetical protein
MPCVLGMCGGCSGCQAWLVAHIPSLQPNAKAPDSPATMSTINGAESPHHLRAKLLATTQKAWSLLLKPL